MLAIDAIPAWVDARLLTVAIDGLPPRTLRTVTGLLDRRGPMTFPYGRPMQLLGICFAGSSTGQRLPMTQFVGQVLGLPQIQVDGVEADLFRLPDGSSFAVASPGGMGESTRSLGFLVANLDEAIADLDAAGVTTDAPNSNAVERYVHFTAPDGHLYELVERL